jgi:hypothetical protein
MGPGKQRRVNDFGRAFAGSQRQIQTYVNLRPVELSRKLLEVLSPPPPANTKLTWVSPLATKEFKELRDDEFLRALDLDKYIGDLREFWPEGGPSWDALGRLEGDAGEGIVLVEAKSHILELKSQCQAEDLESRGKIAKAFAETKEWLNVEQSSDWTKPYYQSANRLALLYFFRKRAIEAWLVNVYFLNDPHFKNPASPRTREEWNPPIEDVAKALGFPGKDIPYTGKLFLEASGEY